MRNSVQYGRRLAARVFAGQVFAAAAAASGWLCASPSHAAGALGGGLAVALGTGCFALRYFGGEGVSAGTALARLVGATAVKWTVVVMILYVAVARLELPQLAVLTGLVSALAMNVVGLLFESSATGPSPPPARTNQRSE